MTDHDDHTGDSPVDVSPDVVADAIHGAVAEAIRATDDGAMLVNYVATLEVMSREGEREVWLLSTPDMPPWTRVGLVEYTRDISRASRVAEVVVTDE